MNPYDLPELADARFVRNYVFRHPQQGPCSCVLVTDCKSMSNIQYTHVMYVYEHGDFLTGRPCFAVTSEVNRAAPPGSERSHFLCVFSDGTHANLGAADAWADLESFAQKALEVIVAHFSLSTPPEEIAVPTIMLQRFHVPPSRGAGKRP